MKIKRDDNVKVLYGKDAGKTGRVMKVFPAVSKVVVEGVNVFKRHTKGDGRQKKSDIVDLIKPMSVAKVMFVCPSCKKTSRIGMENGQRICKKCKKKIDEVKEKTKEKKETKTKSKKK